MFKKIIKRSLIVIGVLLLLIIGALFLVPILFKDQIKAAIDDEIVKYVDADVHFSPDDFGVSVFSSFPNISAELDNFSVVGRQDFAGDTILSVKTLKATVDIWSVLFEEEMKIKGVYLHTPRIFATVNESGKASWDIVRPQPLDTTTSDEPAKPINLAIEHWEINDALVIYDDHPGNIYLKVDDLDHKGSGKLNNDVFDLDTKTSIAALGFDYGGVNYINDKKIEAKIILGMDMANSKYTFKDNNLKVNDFELMFEGFLAMPSDAIDMDLKVKSLKNDFKSLLSLVPNVYTDSFKDIETKGTLQFDAFAKGQYKGDQLPSFGLNLKVADAMFHYPDLPIAVNNIATDVAISNKDGVIDHTNIDVKKLHLDFGKNPVDAKVHIDGIKTMNINGNVKAKLNLADLIRLFPIDGMDLKGAFDLDAHAKGVYDGQRMPVVNAKMILNNGYVKSKDLPVPLQNINLQAQAISDGTMPNSEVDLQKFSMVLEGETLEAQAFVKNFDDINFDVWVKGGVDLQKITKIYPIEGMSLQGHLLADIKTKGKMSDIEAHQYQNIPTSGNLTLTNFVYKADDVPTIKITDTYLVFHPKEINLERFSGFAGKSDMKASGTLSNYLGYLLNHETLKGTLDFSSHYFDANEWIAEESPSESAPKTPSPEEEASESSNMSVVPIPHNIDFVLVSTLDKIDYDNLTLKNAKGKVLVKDGKLTMQNLFFNMLGGHVVANGVYDTEDIKHPKFDFDFQIKGFSIKESAKTLVTVRKIAPLVQSMTGTFDTHFKMKGELGQDMMPLFNSIDGGGLIEVANSSIKDAPLLKQLGNTAQLKDINPLSMVDFFMKAKIKNGRVHFQPYTVQAGKYTMLIEGSNGLDGSLDYKLKLALPAGLAGQQLSNQLSSLSGGAFSSKEDVKVNLAVGGNYKSPKIKLLGVDKQSIKKKVKEVIENHEVTKKVKKDVSAQVNKIMDDARQKANTLKAQTKIQADRIRSEADKAAKQMVDEAVKQAGPNPFAKKVAKKAAEKAAQKSKAAAYRKAKQMEDEVNKKADAIMDNAQRNANKLKSTYE